MALDRPVAGRIFFEQLIRDNIDIGRPDKVTSSSIARSACAARTLLQAPSGPR